MKLFNKPMLVAILTALSISAYSFEAKNEDGVTIYYSITSSIDMTCAVTNQGTTNGDYSYDYSGEVNIPSSVVYNNKTYKVTSIANNAFNKCINLTSVTIPQSVTAIGTGAFSRCKSLISITIPYGVSSIENSTFLDCYSLSSVSIPETVTSIGESAFYSCRGLTSVSIPESVISIGEEAFSRCI